MTRLLLKHEGHNPTGSFKDRGMTVGVTQACRIGAAAVACASTGNTSASLAAYAAQAGLPALVLVPTDRSRWASWRSRWPTARATLLVRGDFDDCLRLVEAASERLGVYLLNSINPFRLEGQKTIVLEMLQQLGWDAAGLDRAARGQPRQHRRVRQGAARGAGVGTDRPRAAPRRRAGRGRGAVRAELRGGVRARGTR